jgi:3-methyladenine DNA glycosylase/8-oxoguanine DNA glycosylase
VFEALFHSILGQQVSVRSANAVKQRLIDAAAAHLEVDRVEVPRVPSPSEILRLGGDGLRANGTSGAKARSLLALAADERAGRWSPEALDPLDTAEVVVALDAAQGVGRWTAENAALRGLGRPDAFVAGDLGVRISLAAYGAVPRTADESAARAWADRHYPGWGNYATLYLWRKWTTEGRPAGRSPDPHEPPASRAVRRRGETGRAPGGPLPLAGARSSRGLLRGPPPDRTNGRGRTRASLGPARGPGHRGLEGA